jgi:hypothetical protein
VLGRVDRREDIVEDAESSMAAPFRKELFFFRYVLRSIFEALFVAPEHNSLCDEIEDMTAAAAMPLLCVEAVEVGEALDSRPVLTLIVHNEVS